MDQVSSSPSPARVHDADTAPLRVALAGMVALAVAMGIGRFAFTPLLPMMLHDGVVDIATGSWLATANYAGYLAGALLYMALPWLGRRLGAVPGNAALARGGLVATVLLTGVLALPWPASWPLLRFLAGVASALVFLGTANWCMGQLTRLGRPQLAGLIFCGPGLGIVVTGLPTGAMVAAGWSAAAGWATFAALAAVLCAGIWQVLRGGEAQGHAAGTPAAASLPAPAAQRALHAVAYGLAGLGYIVTATFLPVIARAALPAGSAWPDLFWPVFGAGVALGAFLSTRIAPHRDRRWLLAGAYLLQAVGIALGLLWPGPVGFALGSLLLGLPFTAITFFALQEARHQWPQAGAGFTGLLTALYGIGQIAGPPMAAALLAHASTQSQGFDWALGVAGSVLVLGAALYALMAWCWRK
ncbi:YbfB/YjiJ family MFS transporter [Acidovorax sp.]|uniref:YbfB/YjiJ family MFS transporter n=1 Tax=Acidovorax sp. TaxID=1872122 RepID=UPI002ACE1727|nr:YbfB/YjiJ family MFS transporter [Acidovorax sp.]MDZ7864773.1 YbfB/YjiJ family MFS transporter [Acidovorax sp.]